LKITLDIPELIFSKAKARAAASGIPLRQFIAEAVADKLATPPSSQDKPWMKGFGALKHLHRETVRIQKLIDAEFGQVERG
jgi:hypothetical protein